MMRFESTSKRDMRAVDANVVVRLLVRDNPEQVEAAEKFSSGEAWVSHLVLVESIWVLDVVYERTAGEIATAVEMLLNHETLTLQDADVVTAALEHFKRRPTLGFSDCLVMETARKAGPLSLGTFDKALAKLGGAVRLQ